MQMPIENGMAFGLGRDRKMGTGRKMIIFVFNEDFL